MRSNRWLMFCLLATPGCAALGESAHKGADMLFGAAPPPPQALDTVATMLPFPWNLLAVAVGSGVIGMWGYHYRNRLLETPPPSRT